jgi:hypothetical protein
LKHTLKLFHIYVLKMVNKKIINVLIINIIF